ncbi:MAG: type I polyketide synthase, partial [Burkholderiales bacterium]
MACRFPGAPSLTDFWTLLCQGRDGIGPVPKHRWDAEAMFNEDPKAPGKINTRFGGFIDDVDRFDAAFFGISPREATQMDPQQRILLELAYEALEDGGLPPTALAGTDTAVYVGAMTNDYMRHQLADSYRRIDVHTGSGAGLCMLANRLSYQFDLRGPSAAVDSACSSSLVAVFHACQSLWTGQSRLALAAGVNLMLDPAFNVFYAKAGLSAPDGRCKTFSAGADGIGRAEGAGVVVLKALQDALADKDPIYAVIRGGAINHDGRSNGLTQPNRWAQEQLLRRAFAHSGIDKDELEYIELHGTGTLIGDPIEANALAAVLTESSERNNSCLVGSVKTNIGHLEAAAGIAGLIKLALSISHAGIPPSLWFDAHNPHIAFERMPIRVNTARLPWSTRNGRRLGGISSFGLGGTNAHLVLESAPTVHVESNRAPATTDHWLFLSARSETALKALAARFIAFLSITSESDLPAVCGTALGRKGIHDFRLSIIGCNKASLIEGLQAFSAGADDPKIVYGRFRPSHRRVFLAAPEHRRIDTQRLSRWVTTAPIARETWNACRAMFRDYGNLTLSSADALSAHPEMVASDPNFRAWHFAAQYALLNQVIC